MRYKVFVQEVNRATKIALVLLDTLLVCLLVSLPVGLGDESFLAGCAKVLVLFIRNTTLLVG